MTEPRSPEFREFYRWFDWMVAWTPWLVPGFYAPAQNAWGAVYVVQPWAQVNRPAGSPTTVLDPVWLETTAEVESRWRRERGL